MSTPSLKQIKPSRQQTSRIVQIFSTFFAIYDFTHFINHWTFNLLLNQLSKILKNTSALIMLLAINTPKNKVAFMLLFGTESVC